MTNRKSDHDQHFPSRRNDFKNRIGGRGIIESGIGRFGIGGRGIGGRGISQCFDKRCISPENERNNWERCDAIQENEISGPGTVVRGIGGRRIGGRRIGGRGISERDISRGFKERCASKSPENLNNNNWESGFSQEEERCDAIQKNGIGGRGIVLHGVGGRGTKGCGIGKRGMSRSFNERCLSKGPENEKNTWESGSSQEGENYDAIPKNGSAGREMSEGNSEWRSTESLENEDENWAATRLGQVAEIHDGARRNGFGRRAMSKGINQRSSNLNPENERQNHESQFNPEGGRPRDVVRRSNIHDQREKENPNNEGRNGEYNHGSGNICNQRSNEGLQSETGRLHSGRIRQISSRRSHYSQSPIDDFRRANNIGQTPLLEVTEVVDRTIRVSDEFGPSRISEIMVGDVIDVVVRCAMKPFIYWVVRANDVCKIEELNETLNSTLKIQKSLVTYRKKKGQLVAAYHKGRWYRVQIMAWANKRESVVFTELGIKCKVEMSELAELPQNLKSIPRFAFKVKLVDSTPDEYGRLVHDDRITVRVLSTLDEFSLEAAIVSDESDFVKENDKNQNCKNTATLCNEDHQEVNTIRNQNLRR